jgi:hypothetical protein
VDSLQGMPKCFSLFKKAVKTIKSLKSKRFTEGKKIQVSILDRLTDQIFQEQKFVLLFSGARNGLEPSTSAAKALIHNTRSQLGRRHRHVSFFSATRAIGTSGVLRKKKRKKSGAMA